MSIQRFYLLALAASVACASAGTSGTGTGRNPNVIFSPEIAASHETNAFDLIRKLRPMYLNTRGVSSINNRGSDYAMVYMDGQQFGDLSTLRNISTAQIREIRYYSTSDAMTKFGMQAGGAGAIEILTK